VRARPKRLPCQGLSQQTVCELESVTKTLIIPGEIPYSPNPPTTIRSSRFPSGIVLRFKRWPRQNSVR